MNFFGNCCGGNTCDLLTYIILLSVIGNCGCGCSNDCGCGNQCQDKCGCGMDICTLLILFMFFGNSGNKCCCK